MTTDQPIVPEKRSHPKFRSRWWGALLALSLGLNFLVAGAVIGHRIWGGPPDRAGYLQLLPRKFFADLPRQRRQELLSTLKEGMEGMKGLREQANVASLRIADALEKEPFDPAAVQQAVTDFAIGSQGLATKGSALVTSIVAKLTPEERLQLAAAIRERDQQKMKRK